MSTREPSEDAIDLQALQAQIDLSMSFAQNLVTSWVKPTHFAQHTKKKDLETELKEYMRRPPRLGVGAPIPEVHSFTREAIKLKSKIEGGKKRRRVEETVQAEPSLSGSEEESRTGAIKKRVRVDPFDPTTKKKKKGAETAPQATTPGVVSQTMPSTTKEDDLPEVESTNHGTLEPSKKRHHSKHDKESQKQVWVPSSQAALLNTETMNGGVKLQQNLSAPETPSTSIPPAPLVQSPPTSPTTPKIVDVSLTATPVVSPDRSIPDPGFLEQPLLNLAALPSGEESDEDEKPEQPNSKVKRRRRRRKKRKKHGAEVPAHVEV